jgi:methionyl-tRNA synthetase
MTKKFYVTTPIYYPNDIPHIGHAYTTIVADVLARWNKLLGKDVFFLTGTDDHGKKIADVAKSKGLSPKEFTDKLIPEFKQAWKKLNINYTKFIRTTDKDHEQVVKEVLQKCYDNGDIYLGEYEGLYCTGCEAYYTEKDLENNLCPIHKKKVEVIKETSYFFKLSKYQNKLLELYKKNPEFISPDNRKQEIINRVKEGLRDLSISRTSFDWGIPLPFDKKHVCYVWFDALFNYYSGVKGKNYWPPNIHLIGKDILWFHSVYWPAFLISAKIKLPEKIFAHGWWTFDNEKISKSRGRVLNIDELISIAGVDSARYFLCRATPFGDDGDFSEKTLIERHNNELANKLGNLISRVSTLAEKYGLEKTRNSLIKKLKLKKIEKHFENYELDKALNEIFAFIDICNEYTQNKKPWETKDKKILYELADSIKIFSILLFPFIPETCEKIANTFNFEILYKNINKPLNISKINKSKILFEKIEIKEKQIQGIMNTIDFKDFEKIDLRVGKITEVEDIEGADKLYKLSINLGSEKRTICAGIKEYYSKKELLNKNVIVISNLAPRKMRGIESQGMLLAAVSDDHKKVVLISPEKEISPGSKVS